MSKGSIFIVSAPSGAGKTTICRQVLASSPGISQSVSFTTRQPRKGEVKDLDYTYVTEQDFMEMVRGGEFVEWANVHGNLYGTSRQRLEEMMGSGLDVILDIDTQGAKQIRDTYGAGVFIFILPPSLGVLRQRLEERMSSTNEMKEDIERRLGRAVDEIKDYEMYDYVIINDVLENSIKSLTAIISAERLSSRKIEPDWIKEHFLK